MIGTALEMNRMPAVTLRKSIAQSAQNCGVRSARDGGASIEDDGAARGAAAAVVAGTVAAAAGLRRNDAQIPPSTAKITPDQTNVDMIVPVAASDSIAVPPCAR